MNQSTNSRFKFFPQLNDLEKDDWLSSANTFFPSITDKHFASDTLQDKFLRALAHSRLMSIKEVFETFELFARVRRPTKSPVMADLCCGHGLLGILFAIFERKVTNVFLVDKCENESRINLIDVATSVAPWVADKLKPQVASIETEGEWTNSNSKTAIVSAHACGELTDRCIEIAIKTNGPLAILPCCYPKAGCRAPLAIQTQFGLTAAFDIDRTFRLESAGYQVRWTEIPRQITPMNRVLYARPKTTTASNLNTPSVE